MTSDPGGHDRSGRDDDPVLVMLAERFALGDLNPKRYARLRQQALAALGRRKIAPSLVPNEVIAAEHHWVEGHARLPDAPFAETGQTAGSLYATDRRLFRWRFHDAGSPSATPPADAKDSVEFVWYNEIAGVEQRRSFRWGEAATGLVIAAFAWLMYDRLAVTGPILMAVGGFGVAHALLAPTRYVAVMVAGTEASWPVWAARTKSGRAVLGEIARRTSSSGDPAAEYLSMGGSPRGDHARRQP